MSDKDKFSKGMLDKQLEIFQPEGGYEPYIVCAAFRYGDIIVPGPRHGSVTMLNLILYCFKKEILEKMDKLKEESGFIDQHGKFYTREEALVITKKNGQYGRYREPSNLNKLYSEDLY